MGDFNQAPVDAHEQRPSGVQKMIDQSVEGVVINGTTLRAFYFGAVPGRELDFFMEFYSQFAALVQITAGLLRGTESASEVVKNSTAWLETDISALIERGTPGNKQKLKEHSIKGVTLGADYIAALVQTGILSIRK